MSDPNGEAPLPSGWSRGYSKKQQRTFYFHKETKHTQWHFPTASEAKDPLKAKHRADMNKQGEQKRSGEETASSSSSSRGDLTNSGRSSTASAAPPTSKRPRTDDFLAMADTTSTAIIVPYRDLHPAQHRASHLRQFVPHMNLFLSKLQQAGGLISDYHIYIIEQSDDGRKFNRGKLLNIGFDLARKSGRNHDVFIFHDVDLLPQDDLGRWYAKFPQKPIHIARVWDRYSKNTQYVGGVISFSSSDYKRINGYPNT